MLELNLRTFQNIPGVTFFSREFQDFKGANPVPNYSRLQPVWNSQVAGVPALIKMGFEAPESLTAGFDQPQLNWNSLNCLCIGIGRAKTTNDEEMGAILTTCSQETAAARQTANNGPSCIIFVMIDPC